MSKNSKHIEPKWLMLGGAGMILVNPILPTVLGALFFLTGLLFFLSGLVEWGLKSRGKSKQPEKTKSSSVLSSSVSASKTEVIQSTNSTSKTSQKRSTNLSQSKMWRGVQVLYGLAGTIIIIVCAVSASEPTCTGGGSGGLSFYRTPEICTQPEPALPVIVAALALTLVVGIYFLFRWAVGYIAYGR